MSGKITVGDQGTSIAKTSLNELVMEINNLEIFKVTVDPTTNTSNLSIGGEFGKEVFRVVTNLDTNRNRLEVSTSTLTGSVNLAAQGLDSNIPLTVAAKGTSTVRFQTRGATAFEVNAVGTPLNFIRVNATSSGGTPQIISQGSDTNVALQLSAKGTAPVSASAPLQIPGFTVATLPSASTFNRCLIYVTDGTANKRLAVSDGTNWRWPDGAIVS